jgi:hypothetical protein
MHLLSAFGFQMFPESRLKENRGNGVAAVKVRLPMLLVASLMAPIAAYAQVGVSSQTTRIAPDRFMGGISKGATVQTPAAPSEPARRMRAYNVGKSIRDICRGC